MKVNGLKINTITYNSAIAALSKAARNSEGDITSLLWEKALLLIKDTIRQSTIPNDFIPSITLPRLIGPKLAKVVDRLELYSISKPIENSSDYLTTRIC